MSKTVVVTSANSITGGWLLPKLRWEGRKTIGLIRSAANIEADVIITDWVNSPKAIEALKSADVIVHLSGEISAKSEKIYQSVNIDTTKIVADAAKNGKATRVIFLSYPNVDPNHKNWHLKYKGLAEQILLNCGKEAVIFRCPAIIDSPESPVQTVEAYLSKNGKAVQTLGSGKQKLRPIFRGDVVDAITAALEKGSAGIHELSGLEEFTVDELIRLINQNPDVKISHTPPWLAKILSHFIPDLSPTFADILLNHLDSAESSDTYREFGITPTPLSKVWERK